MPLRVDKRSQWTELTLDRPPRNELDTGMLGALVAALDDLGADGLPLLLQAAGRHFSTGYPISEIPAEIFHHDAAVRAATPFEQVMDRLVHYPAPVLAAVQGDAYGGAVEMLACADLRVAAAGVRLGVPPVRLGLVYSHTGLRRLLRGFGSPLVREMLMLGEAIDAERAHRAGFFNRLVPAADLLATARDMMRAITRGGPAALRGTRRILNLLEEWESLPAEALAEIGQLRHASRSGDEFVRAREAFLNKEPSPFGAEAADDS
jgi:enoyl-CoA hydratase/carnithine racemase